MSPRRPPPGGARRSSAGERVGPAGRGAKGSGDRGSDPSSGRGWRRGRQAAGRANGLRAPHRARRPGRARRVARPQALCPGPLGALVEPSSDRVEPRCPHYIDDECGGCQVQHLDYQAQLCGPAHASWATRSGGWAGAMWPIPPLVPAAEDFDYRTKLTLHVSRDGRRIGLHPLRPAGRGVRPAVVPHHRLPS